MVSQITSGSSTGPDGRPFPRRRRTPALVAGAALMVVGLIAWMVVLTGGEEESVPTDCNMPVAAAPGPDADPAAEPAPVPEFSRMGRDEALGVAPAPLAAFQIRVLNASGERGAARSASDDLTGLGFNPVPDAPYADDTVYTDANLDCVAQIRFGPAGQASATAVWLALPCAQLVDDGRTGNAVDVALGVHYSGLTQTQDAQAALEALASADPRNPEAGADPGLVEAVHSQSC